MSDEASFERRLDARLVASIVATGIMSFAGVVVETAMNVAFPALMADFSVDTATVQWITTGYLLVLSLVVPLSAFLKRRFKSRSLFLAALLLFAVGTVACALAPDFRVLLAGRVVQGVGTGIALPLMFNIVIEQAPLSRLGMMMGLATLITATAPAVGPSVGGLLIGAFGWRAVFAVLLPFLAVAGIVGARSIRQSSPIERPSFSVAEFLLLAGGFASLVFALNRTSQAGWASLEVLGLFALAAVLLAAFVLHASRCACPLVDVAAFRCAPFTLSVCYVVLFQAIVLGLGYLIPYFAQTVRGLDALAAGCLLLPGCLVGAAMAPLGGRILDAFGALRPIISGGLLQAGALCLFSLFGLEGPTWILALVYVLVPVGQGLSMANSMTNGLSYLDTRLKTDGNAVFNTLQQLGGALGTAVAASIVATAQEGGADLAAATSTGVQDAFFALWAMAAVAFACLVGVFVSKGARRSAAGASAS